MQEKPWHPKFGVVQAVLNQEQLIGYLTGKVIEQFSKWQNSQDLNELEESKEYMTRLIFEVKAADAGRESVSCLAQSIFEYFVEKRLIEADSSETDQAKKKEKKSV